MKLAAWNVNSLKVRLPQLLEWLSAQQPDVVCLQETKLEDHNFPQQAIEAAGYQVVFSGQKTYNGIALLARETPTDVAYGNPHFSDPQKRLIAATVNGIRVVCAYIPNGQAVGIVSYLRITPAHGRIEIGHLHFSEALKHTLAATEALWLLLREAFALGYRRMEWKCNALNAPSRRAAQRLGFSFEGVFRQANVSKGRNRDTAWYGMIDADWPALAAAFGQWLAPENFDAAGHQRASLSALTRPLLVAVG